MTTAVLRQNLVPSTSERQSEWVPTFESLGFDDPLAQERAGLSITLRLLDGSGVFKQVTVTRERADTWRVRVSTAESGVSLASIECNSSKVAGHVEELNRLRLSPSPESLMVIHGNLYDLWVASGSALNHFGFAGVPGDLSGDNPLQLWADEFIRVVDESCAGEDP